MASSPITSWQIDGESVETVTDFILGCSKITADGDYNHKIKRRLLPGGSDSKIGCLQCGRPGFNLWVRKIPWRRKWQPTPVLLPGKFHWWRSLVGYSPWGHKESDMTEQFHFHWKKSYDKSTQCIEKQRHHPADEGLYRHSYGLSSSHIWMWELNRKEGWVPKNWYFQIVVLGRLLSVPGSAKKSNQSILKEIKPEYSM